MTPSERTLDEQLLASLKALELECKILSSCYTFDGKDAADTIYADLTRRFRREMSRAERLLASSGGEGMYSLKRFMSRRRRMKQMDVAIDGVTHLQSDMRRISELRAGVKTVSTLAYMTVPPSRRRHNTIQPFDWVMKVTRVPDPSAPDRWLSPWVVLGYDESQFIEWWESRLALCRLSDPVGQEWKDMQALSNGIILLLNILGLEGICQDNENNSLSQYMRELPSLLERLAIKLYELLAYPERFFVTSELLGFAAAMVFCALNLFNNIQAFLSERKNCPPIHDSQGALEYFERQVQLLYDTVKEIIENSERVYNEASKSKVAAVVLRGSHLAEQTASSNRLGKEATEEEVDKAGILLETVRSFDISDLKMLLIPEIRLSSGEGRQIGFGSSSVVFERHASGRTRRYAVKEPSGVTEFNMDALWNKIGREAQVWRQLNHENIVALRGFCILSNRLPGLVMDVYRWNLKDFVRENSLSVGDDLELLHGASRGLSYLHSENIAHGDLRACNILVKENELGRGFTALLADFGTAYFVNGTARPNEERKFQTTHDQVGNVGWLSPELLRKKESPNEEDTNEPIISIPGDIYSFGCVFLEVIYNRIPYQGCVSDSVKKQKILQGLPPASREETGDDYYDFLSSMWNVVPDQRPCADSVSGQIVNFLQAV